MVNQLRCLMLLAVLAPLAVATAQDQIKCNQAGTQLELNACAADEFKQADKELNAAYSALLKQQAGKRTFIKKLRAAQRAWIAFRDAEMDATFACEPADAPCWGSMLPMSMASYKAKLTRERTARLRELLDRGRTGEAL